MKGLEAETLLEMARTDHALGRPVNPEELFAIVDDSLGWKDEFELADGKHARALRHADDLADQVDKLIDRLEQFEEMGVLPATHKKSLHQLIKKARDAKDKYEEEFPS